MRLMRHDTCYRDNDTSAGKRKSDCKMLAGLSALVPKGRQTAVTKYRWIEIEWEWVSTGVVN